MTISQKQFRILIFIQFALFIVGGVDYYFDDSLPYELNMWLEKSYAEDATLLEYVSPLIGLVGVVSMIGMLFFKAWARNTFLVVAIISYGLGYFEGSSVLSGRTAFYMDLFSCFTGFTLAVVYFSNIDSVFKEKSYKNV